MIYYLVTSRGGDAMNEYARSWGPAPGSRMQVLSYDNLREIKLLKRGTYIFSDVERLSPQELKLAQHVWETLSAAGPRVRLLNNPLHVLRRYGLLCKLFNEGKNRFRAVRATEPFRSLRFPVFVREENDHNGGLTPLIDSPKDVIRSLRPLRLRGYRLRDLLVVEFCNTSDSVGIFRKYSAFRVGSEILPRHILFSRQWSLKKPDLVDPLLAKEQEGYLLDNPHRSWLEEIFQSAGIEYGRIDYSMMGNEPQVWEINTNPTVRKLTPRLTSAFEAIDCPSDSGEAIPITIDQELARAIEAEERGKRRAGLYRRVARRLSSSQWVRPLIPIAKTLLGSPRVSARAWTVSSSGGTDGSSGLPAPSCHAARHGSSRRQ